MENNKKKLSLKKQNLRTLDNAQLEQLDGVVGGTLTVTVTVTLVLTGDTVQN